MKVDSLMFAIIDNVEGQIHELSDNFIKIMQRLGYDVDSLLDLGIQDEPKFIDDLLVNFDF